MGQVAAGVRKQRLLQFRSQEMGVVSLPDWLPKLGELFTDLPGIRGQDPLSPKKHVPSQTAQRNKTGR